MMIKRSVKKGVKKSRFFSENSNKIVISLLALAVVLTVFGTLVNINNLAKLNLGGLILTGAATNGEGNASVTIQGSASMEMTLASISFPTGYYNESCATVTAPKNYSMLNSGSGGMSMCWVNATDGNVPNSTLIAGNHTITNTGTTPLSINLTPNVLNGTELFCGAGGCPTTHGIDIANVSVTSSSAEVGSCSSGLLSSSTNIVSSSTNTSVIVCSYLDYADTTDTLAVFYKFIIPRDASQGTKNLNVTYTATAQ